MWEDCKGILKMKTSTLGHECVSHCTCVTDSWNKQLFFRELC